MPKAPAAADRAGFDEIVAGMREHFDTASTAHEELLPLFEKGTGRPFEPPEPR